MPDAMGPCFAGGFQDFAKDEAGDRHVISYLPDKNNGDLQLAGQAPVYYWIPGAVRIAKRGNVSKFSLTHFVGVRDSETHVGAGSNEEWAGGVLALTTTMAPPASVLQASQEQLMEKFRGDSERYWGWRSPVAPRFAPVPIVSNITTLSNLKPPVDGVTPDPAVDEPEGPEAEGEEEELEEEPDRSARRHPRANLFPRTVSSRKGEFQGRAARSGRIDPWAWVLQGNGPGSISALGENAYSGLIGSLPTAILWQGFQGSYSPLFVSNALRLKLWSQSIRLVIDGDWDSIYTHFSAHAKGGYAWFSGDIQAEVNRMIYEGKGLSVQLQIDGTIPGADEMKKEAQKRLTTISDKFMALAQKVIFDPPKPTTPPAQSSGGGSFLGYNFGLGVALKAKYEKTSLKLHYEETVDEQYLHTHIISSSLEGFFDEIKADPAAAKRYFVTVEIGDWERKVTRIVKPIANWLDKSQGWAGDPVQFMSVQIGYPRTDGKIMWKVGQFNAGNGGDTAQWKFEESMKSADDVRNPPRGWEPDQTLVKRRVHMAEPPSISAFPFSRIMVEEKVVDIDGPKGQWMDDLLLEVRADSVGVLDLEMSLDKVLENSKQVIELTVQPLGKTLKGRTRPAVRYLFTYKDQYDPRYLRLFTGDVNYIPTYQYQVRVVIKGSLSTKGKEWKGPWVPGNANGPLMISIPTEEEAIPGSRKSILPMGRPRWTSAPKYELVTSPEDDMVADRGEDAEEFAPGAPPGGGRAAARRTTAASSSVHGFSYSRGSAGSGGRPRSSRTAKSAKGANEEMEVEDTGDDYGNGALTDVLDDTTLEASETEDELEPAEEEMEPAEEEVPTTGDLYDDAAKAEAADSSLPGDDDVEAVDEDGEEGEEELDDESTLSADTGSEDADGDDASPDWDAEEEEEGELVPPPVAQRMAGGVKATARGRNRKPNGERGRMTKREPGEGEAGWTVRRRDH